MNDICRGTAIVRLSDAAGFEGDEPTRGEDDPEPATGLIDQTVTADDLADILERGFFTCRVDEDGDVVVRDLVNFIIRPGPDGVLLGATFRFREGMDREVMQAMARACNAADWMVRFRVDEEHDLLHAEYFVALEGGVTVRNFGLTLRRFVGSAFHRVRGDHRELIA